MDEANRNAQPAVTSVEIYDQVYHLRGSDSEYIQRLAQTVDAKMRAVAAHGGTVDSLRVAVLASLNMADELETMRERYEAQTGSLRETDSSVRTRSASLAGMLDEVLDDSPMDRKAG
jgi:cell division protein ZapA